MPRDVLVAQAVFDLMARTDGFDVLELMHDLTTHTVRLVEVRSAGVTVLDSDGRVDYLTASDEACRRLEEDQVELDEGPCLDSTRSGSVLGPVSLRPPGPGRWPRFTSRARAAGYSSVASVPLRVSQGTVGAVNLLHSGPRSMTGVDLQLVQVLADTAGICMHQRRTLMVRNEVIAHLETALDSRIVIEQAKGMLAARLGSDVQDAFARLRAHARSRQLKLTDLAHLVVHGHIPAELDRTL
ncbi:GAF and ANTAR domain-containing protein [Streptomyces longispororuber]|uniref:GAF and ANTAR domain-containing protein n=1 Tax=Streptomyces longispororuber TaxID=68230 RepID=UPI00210C3B0B|nr:GAF and ANTAR domain-containing protein [Streptomyces longispororuber]MCQ4205758.1 GAF and ANTAR domain-containing protein [Streptomyces longispororuber]